MACLYAGSVVEEKSDLRAKGGQDPAQCGIKFLLAMLAAWPDQDLERSGSSLACVQNSDFFTC